MRKISVLKETLEGNSSREKKFIAVLARGKLESLRPQSVGENPCGGGVKIKEGRMKN